VFEGRLTYPPLIEKVQLRHYEHDESVEDGNKSNWKRLRVLLRPSEQCITVILM
jgi:hypothetical protein